MPWHGPLVPRAACCALWVEWRGCVKRPGVRVVRGVAGFGLVWLVLPAGSVFPVVEYRANSGRQPGIIVVRDADRGESRGQCARESGVDWVVRSVG